MEHIYLGSLLIGLILLLLNFLTSGLSDIFSVGFGADLAPDVFSGFIPISSLEIFSFLIGFGGIGNTLFNKISWHMIPAIFCGIMLSFATHLLLKKLKHVESSTLQDADLLGKDGIVIASILENSVGSVSFDTKVGKITYTAKSDRPLKQGTKVRVIAIENHTVIVSDELDLF